MPKSILRSKTSKDLVNTYILYLGILAHKVGEFLFTPLPLPLKFATLFISTLSSIYSFILLAKNIQPTKKLSIATKVKHHTYSKKARTHYIATLTSLTLLSLTPFNFLASSHYLIQAIFHSVTFTSLYISIRGTLAKNQKINPYPPKTTHSHVHNQLCNSINQFLPHLVKEHKYHCELEEQYPKHRNERPFTILKKPVFVRDQKNNTVYLTEKGRTKSLPEQFKETTENIPINKIQHRQKIHDFKHQASLSRAYITSLKNMVSNICEHPDTQSIQKGIIHGSIGRKLSYKLEDKNLRKSISTLIELSKTLPHAKSLYTPNSTECHFSKQPTVIPMTLSLEKIDTQTIYHHTVDLMTFRDILSNFLEKTSSTQEEIVKIDKAIHLSAAKGDTQTTQQLKKLHQLHQQFPDCSNAIFKAIQLWPNNSRKLTEALLEQGVECASIGKQKISTLDFAKKKELHETVSVLERYNWSLREQSPAKKSDFHVKTQEAHYWPEINTSFLDPNIRVTGLSLNKEQLGKNIVKNMTNINKKPEYKQKPIDNINRKSDTETYLSSNSFYQHQNQNLDSSDYRTQTRTLKV